MAKGVSIDLIVDPKRAIAGIGRLEAKASGATETLGRIGKVASGALLGLAAAGVAGAVALGAAVIKGYSEYEQLAGGVTKLFGEADQVVEQFAAKAAQTAGLSANQYLDTVTSFSASLISGLQGDQQAAALAADQAITDMADNANTFGSSMESVQAAYQGFAKGQFGLLDNLKLGYGGSAGEMARLVNESGVLGDAMKVTATTVKDVSFDKMIEAIHQVQVGMGIAGTTAKEAASTIQGSFDSTKASIANLVTGLGTADADFDTLVGNVAENAQNLISNVAPVLERVADAVPSIVPVLVSALEKIIPVMVPLAANLIAAIMDGLVKAAPALVKGAVPVVVNLVTGILDMLPAILETGITVLVALVEGISEALPQLIPAAVSAVIGLVSALVKNLPLLIDAGIELVLGLALGLIDALPQLIDQIPVLITGVIVALIGAIPKLISAGVRLFVSLIENLPAIIIGIVKAIPQIVTSIFDAFTDPKTIGQIAQAGGELIKGLWNGIKDLGSWLWSKISGFFGGIVDNIKGFFGIQSPSTLFAGFGKFMVQGLELGLSAPNRLRSITGELSRQVSDGFQGSLAATARATVSTAAVFGGSGRNIDINVYALAPTPEIGRQVRKALDDYERIGGN